MSEPAQLFYYWDSSVFVAFFSDEPHRADVVEQLLEEATAGRITIVTSSFANVEVLKVEGHAPLTEADEKKTSDFFEYPFIRFVDATRSLCDEARHLIWKYPALQPKDAVHLASALAYSERANLDGLFSYDQHFLKLNGMITKKFPIVEPLMKQGILKLNHKGADEKKPGHP